MRRFFTTLVLVTAVIALCSTSFAASNHYLVTNDDNAFAPNTASVFTISGTTLTLKTAVSTGGQGFGGGYFADNRASVAHSMKYGNCLYVSDAGTNDIAGIDLNTLTVTGLFTGSSGDNGQSLGIGLTTKVNYLYANYTASETIATFTEHAGCILKFLGDIGPTAGLNGGALAGLQAHLGVMVGAFADGSYQSWNVSKGMPVSNNDLQLSAGFGQFGCVDTGVDVTADAKWAIFGAACATPIVEVAPISSSGVGASTVTAVGSGINSNNVWLSPDESIIYVSNNSSGQATGVLFNKSTGQLGATCTSGVFKNFGTDYFFTAGEVTRDTTGNGGQLYVAESGGAQGFNAVAIVDVTTGGGSCTLAEDSSSPALDTAATSFMLSVAANPARKF